MCGIAGTIGKDTHQMQEVADMLEKMKHRGPDRSGISLHQNIAIGSNRLWIRGSPDLELPFSILQPHKTNANIYAAFNGQVYSATGGVNEIEQIVEQNHSIDGMYAVAIFDPAKPNTLLLKRDTLGIKPLYYKSATTFAFASEVPPLLLPFFEKSEINHESVNEVLAWGTTLGNKTVYNNIKKVLPAETIEVQSQQDSQNKFTLRVQQLEPTQSSAPVQNANLRQVIQTSLKMCLDSNHPVGIALSGGLDSTILAYELNTLNIQNLHTISLKIENSEDGISSLSELNLPKGGAWETWTHHTATLHPEEFPALLQEATHLFGQPQRMTSFPLYLKLADLAKSAGIKVLLCGEGADEVFMGYQSYNDWFHNRDANSPINQQLLAFSLSAKSKEWLSLLLGEEKFKKMMADFLLHTAPFNQLSPLRALMQLEKELSLEPLLLRTDICLMSRSIEGRVPFLHANLPSFTESLSDGEIFTGNVLKPLLRQAYKECFNSYEIPKIPFRAPIHTWFTSSLKEWAINILYNGMDDLKKLGILESGVSKIIEALRQNESEITPIVYSLISIIYWHQWFNAYPQGA